MSYTLKAGGKIWDFLNRTHVTNGILRLGLQATSAQNDFDV
jgi:hypothetical protein